MPLHDEFLFKSADPWFAFVMKNRGATALTYGNAVCIWNKTSGDAVATTSTAWCRAVSSGDAALYANQGSTRLTSKLIGIVLNGASVAQGADAIVCWAGVVHGVQGTGSILTGDPLKLSTVKGVLTDTALSEVGNGIVAGFAMNTLSGGTVTTFMVPWRM